MATKSSNAFDVTVVGSDRITGNAVSETCRVHSSVFAPASKHDISQWGMLLVQNAHPTWDCLTVQSCMEV